MKILATTRLPIELDAFIAPLDHADLSDVDAIICTLRDRIDDTILESAPRLKVVANLAVGVDNIDLGACAARGVVVANTPDVLTETTAEFAFTLALAAARRLGEGERLVRIGAWTGWALDQLLGVSLIGATLGIVGMGRIGSAFARRATGFGMSVIHCDRNGDVDELFTKADVVSLHCPLTPSTRHIVNASRLALMKPTAILVNTARGGCVDEDALFTALEAGRIFGAGLDVFMHEPEIDPRFYTCPRLVLAPHVGSATTETRTAMANLCAHAVNEVLAGRRPANVVEQTRG